MSLKKHYFKRVLTAALALSIVAGTGAASLTASAKSSETASKISQTVSSFKTWISGYISTHFDTEKVKELEVKLTEKVLAVLPEETRAQFAETVQRLIAEGIPEDMVKQLISDFANAAYELAREVATGAFVAYSKLPDSAREKVDAAARQIISSLQQFKEMETAIKERASKFKIEGKTISLTEGDFIYRLKLTLKEGVVAHAIGYTGEETTIKIPSKADAFTVTSAVLSSAAPVTSVTLPETINTIDGLVAAGIPTIKNIYVSKKNPVYKSVKGIVYDKSGTTLVAVPSNRKFTPDETVTAIGDFAYFCSSMTSLKLPSSVTSIGKGAFCYMPALETVTIPSSVTAIDYYTFYGCTSLKKVTIPSSVTSIADNAFQDANPEAVIYASDASDYSVSFAESHGLKVNVPLSAEFKTSSLVILGASAKLQINASYGAGDYTYYYYVRQLGNTKWMKLATDPQATACMFTPKNTGVYELCLKVKDADGKIKKNYSYLNVGQTRNNRSTISSDTAAVGSSVTVNCDAADKRSQFAVFYKLDSATSWKTVQKYDTNKNVDVTFKQAGNYQVCVKAKSTLGFISKVYFDVTVE